MADRVRFLSLLPPWSSTKWYLLGANAAAVIALIVLGNLGVVPLDPTNFFFFFLVTCLFALYRPGWAFLFLIGVLPLETVNLAPEAFGLALRPYQWLSAALLFALIARFFLKKLPFRFVRLRWYDVCLFLISFGAFLSLASTPEKAAAFKQALVVASFVVLYLLFRQYLQTRDDLRQTLPFFLMSALISMTYALWQNIREQKGLEAYNVMAGRPNGPFSESDWLGMFTVFVLVLLLVLWKEHRQKKDEASNVFRDPRTWLYFALSTLTLLVLVITVSRSAWLGAIGAAIIIIGASFLPFSRERLRQNGKDALTTGFFLGAALVIALLCISVFRLTPFVLSERAASTGTALQTITVACETGLPPKGIAHTDELLPLGCEHILLEEKQERIARGEIVGETLRPDPTIFERRRIYSEVQNILENNALLGIGWGEVGRHLGRDQNGASLNASNAWLEVWLGSGIIGLLGFLVFSVSLLVLPLATLFGKGHKFSSLSLFVLAAAIGLGIFNLFNSGMLLGFFFLFLSVGAIALHEYHSERSTV